MHPIARPSRVFTILAALLGQLTCGALALEVGVPLSTPRLTGLQVEFPVGDATAVLDASFRYDAKGKVVGEATVDGIATVVKGGLKRQGDAWVYGVSFKGTSARVSLSIAGTIGTGVASIKYSGPKGKASLAEFPIQLQASVGSTSGELNVSIQVDPLGAITGSGTFTSGLGNDPPGEGVVKGKVTRSSLNISFKSGKQKVTFKGSLDGEYFLGLLRVVSPPAKESVESFRIPVSAIPLPPDDDDDGGHEEEDLLFYISLLSGSGPGGSVNVNRVTSSSGRRFQRAYVAMNNSSGDAYHGNLDGVEFGADDTIPPDRTGQWFSVAIYRYVYDLQTNRFTKQERLGTFTISVDSVEGDDVSGSWRFESTEGALIDHGTWRHRRVPPPPEDPIVQTELVHAIDLLLDEQAFTSAGSVLIYRTTRQSGAKGWGAHVGGTNGETSYSTDSSLELPAIPELPSAPGAWLTVPVVTYDPQSGSPSPYGTVSMAVEQVAGSVTSGSWRLEKEGATLQSGTWRLDTDPVQMTEQIYNIGLDLPEQGPAAGGQLTVYRNTRLSGAVFWSAYVSGVTGVDSFASDASVLPEIEALPSAPGDWFTIPVAIYEVSSGAFVPFGTLAFAVGAVEASSRSGTWSVKDLGGAERSTGTWQVSLAP